LETLIGMNIRQIFSQRCTKNENWLGMKATKRDNVKIECQMYYGRKLKTLIASYNGEILREDDPCFDTNLCVHIGWQIPGLYPAPVSLWARSLVPALANI
jgi:hypothetical protein